MTQLDGTLAALAEPTRLAVVRLLKEKPRCASELADALSVSRPMMSRHLRVLRRSGLVVGELQERDARLRLYRLQQEPFAELRSFAEEMEAFWTDQLESFRAHAEAKDGA